MATVVQKALLLEEANIEQYCSASGLSLNTGGYAIRKYLNGGSSGYATLNAAAKELLYPTAMAHPFKVDSEIRGSRSAGSMTVNLQFARTNVHSESFTSTSLSTRTKTDISGSVVTGSSRNTEIRWNVQGANLNNQRIAHVKLVLYFYQYYCAANVVGNGIANAAVSNAAPYQGESVTFTAAVKPGAVWHGWYADATCTQLVSTAQTYSTAAADLTLYAKATREVTGTGTYAKAGGHWAEAQDVYKKVNGAWVSQTDDSYKTEIQNGNYIVKELKMSDDDKTYSGLLEEE